MTQKNVLIITTNFGIEKDELLEPIKALKNDNICITHAATSMDDVQTVVGDKDFDVIVKPNIALEDVDPTQFDLLIVPGGTVNADTLRINQDAQKILKSFTQQQKPVAMICHAPWLLIDTAVIQNKTLTSFSSICLDLENAGGKWIDTEVSVCDSEGFRLITSRCPDDLPAFNETILNELSI